MGIFKRIIPEFSGLGNGGKRNYGETEPRDIQAISELFAGAYNPDWNSAKNDLELNNSIDKWVREEVLRDQGNSAYEFTLSEAAFIPFETFSALPVGDRTLRFEVFCKCVRGGNPNDLYVVPLYVKRNSRVNYVIYHVGRVIKEG